ncbi:MAG: hypothetical protein KC561_18860, partial [Myxococcales bacterium]|nr:hypothetical protein [Myxococcales bacterium]
MTRLFGTEGASTRSRIVGVVLGLVFLFGVLGSAGSVAQPAQDDGSGQGAEQLLDGSGESAAVGGADIVVPPPEDVVPAAPDGVAVAEVQDNPEDDSTEVAAATPDAPEETSEADASEGTGAGADLMAGGEGVPPSDDGIFVRVLSFIGLLVLIGIAWVTSTERKSVKWRPVLWGVGLQLIIGVVLFQVGGVKEAIFDFTGKAVTRLIGFSEAGTSFLLSAFSTGEVGASNYNLAFWVLPTVIFFSALMTLLYHYGIMQRIVSVVSWVMERTLRTSGAESLSAASNIFLGQTEAPLVIKPFVSKMTVSELHSVMVAG